MFEDIRVGAFFFRCGLETSYKEMPNDNPLPTREMFCFLLILTGKLSMLYTQTKQSVESLGAPRRALLIPVSMHDGDKVN